MDTHVEILFGRIAVLSKFVTQEQIDECIMLQEERIRTHPDEPLHLGTILVSKKYLTEREKRAILQVQKENLQKRESGTSARRQERIFGYLVMRLGYCNEQQVYECVREQARLARFNLFFKLGEVFVSKQYLDFEQVEEILALQGKFIVTCPGCKTKFNVVRYQAGSKVKCPECGTIITVPDVLDEIGKKKVDEIEDIDDENETSIDFTKPGELVIDSSFDNETTDVSTGELMDEEFDEENVKPEDTSVKTVNDDHANQTNVPDVDDEEKTEHIEQALDDITEVIRMRDLNYDSSSEIEPQDEEKSEEEIDNEESDDESENSTE